MAQNDLSAVTDRNNLAKLELTPREALDALYRLKSLQA